MPNDWQKPPFKVVLRNAQKAASVRAWRKFPDDPIAEVERLELEKTIKRLGWERAHISRVMNSVASEEGFRFRVHEAIEAAGDRLLYIRAGAPHAQPEDGDIPPEDDLDARGYTHSAGLSLDGDDHPHPDDVPNYTKSVEARERFAKLRAAEDQRREVEQLSGKLKALHKKAERTGVDLSGEIETVTRVLANAEDKMAA